MGSGVSTGQTQQTARDVIQIKVKEKLNMNEDNIGDGDLNLINSKNALAPGVSARSQDAAVHVRGEEKAKSPTRGVSARSQDAAVHVRGEEEDTPLNSLTRGVSARSQYAAVHVGGEEKAKSLTRGVSARSQYAAVHVGGEEKVKSLTRGVSARSQYAAVHVGGEEKVKSLTRGVSDAALLTKKKSQVFEESASKKIANMNTGDDELETMIVVHSHANTDGVRKLIRNETKRMEFKSFVLEHHFNSSYKMEEFLRYCIKIENFRNQQNPSKAIDQGRETMIYYIEEAKYMDGDHPLVVIQESMENAGYDQGINDLSLDELRTILFKSQEDIIGKLMPLVAQFMFSPHGLKLDADDERKKECEFRRILKMRSAATSRATSRAPSRTPSRRPSFGTIDLNPTDKALFNEDDEEQLSFRLRSIAVDTPLEVVPASV